MKSADFVVGYGSLLNQESREKSIGNTPRLTFPVVVSGFERRWCAQTTAVGPGCTYLGTVPYETAKIHALAFQVTGDELAAIDRREAGYSRELIPKSKIRMVSGFGIEKNNTAKFWIYNFSGEQSPTSDHPILQSYVDLCLQGCIEIALGFGCKEKIDFAKAFVDETKWWSHCWVNDRKHPRRPSSETRNARTIDKILAVQLKIFFDEIVIE